MSWNLRPTAEKLYLHRGKDENDDIFVQAALHQHHIDGIRFLHKQFKRKKPGVILNNPHGYGNSLQVTLFLGAIQHLLMKPILIICKEGEEYDWLELFQKHTQCYHVVVNASNAFVKKSIFINNMDGVEMFARRPWGAIVVDNEGFLKMKTLHTKFEAEYKIWITSDDIKDQLSTFSVIYKWIFPKEKFNPDDFKAKPEDRKDMISKSILLATFLEDIVFRSKHMNPFENPCESNEKTQKVSEKKKDVTGTKIKRSKRVAEETNNTNPDVSATKLPKVNNDNNHNSKKDINTISLSNVGNSDSESVATNMKDKHSDLDVETFISSKEPIKNHLFNFDNVSNESQDSKMVLHYSENIMECDVNAPNCADVNMLSSLDKTSDRDITMSPGSDDNAYELETQEFNNDNNIELNNIEHKEIKIEEVCPNLENNDHVNEKDETKSVDAENDNSENDQIEDNGIDKETEILNKHDKVGSKEDVRKEKEITQGSQNIKSDLNNTTVNIDTKISEHEDRIIKKFKGTFLDSIF